jgi:enoyl-CoA hydratase/carnithine racemase
MKNLKHLQTHQGNPMTAQLKSTSHGRTMVLTLSNPSMRNAMGPEIFAAGIEALNVAESNPEVRSVVITGEGEHFCAGGNLNRLMHNRQQEPAVQGASLDVLHSWIETIQAFPKPVIAAVEGAAAGAGFSLALACDFIVAARQAVFVMSYSNIGLSPDGGASWSLSHALPRQLAKELLMSAQRIDADRLHQLGVVNRVTEPYGALDEALKLAEHLNNRAPNVMASIKDLLQEAETRSLPQQLALEKEQFLRNLHHTNAGIGIEAFLNKKPPIFE